MENALKALGWDGWELVDIIYPQSAQGGSWATPVAVLRRQVTDEFPMTPARFK